ncbi:MAG: glycosyltransferase family 4 protein [Candidatus Calescibacterium sp.]|nr:glycosyltransferase family 4 protein [Candidatus Calescibacterium sp.]MCX7733515.1 glycosyltransferase family 4 protein [bacterium]MDW8087228.1 glycosyltransferase family 4 protein [Candidatus Calescibacterium sp.]
MKGIKVGIITPYFYPHFGGVSTHVYQKYRILKNQGIDVKIISPDFGECELISTQDHIKLGKPIKIVYNGSLSHITLAFGAKEILRKEKFDIVHLHEPYHPFCIPFVSDDTGYRYLSTFHVFKEEVEKMILIISDTILKSIKSRIRNFIAVSNSASQMLQKTLGIAKEKIRIIPNGIDYKIFSEAKPLEIFNDDEFKILYVGRLEPRKGVKHLIRAFRTVKKIIPRSRLIIVGDGFKTYYMSFLTDEIEKDVLFLGKVGYEELPRIYKSSDVCVFPSTRGESFGIVLLEAMAAGKPVIAGNAEGYVETLQNGRYGIIVNPQDEDALARAIVEMYYREDLRKELSEKGKEYAQQFDWQKIIGKIIDLYESTLTS